MKEFFFYYLIFSLLLAEFFIIDEINSWPDKFYDYFAANVWADLWDMIND
jgi:hypothetical protein